MSGDFSFARWSFSSACLNWTWLLNANYSRKLRPLHNFWTHPNSDNKNPRKKTAKNSRNHSIKVCSRTVEQRHLENVIFFDDCGFFGNLLSSGVIWWYWWLRDPPLMLQTLINQKNIIVSQGIKDSRSVWTMMLQISLKVLVQLVLDVRGFWKKKYLFKFSKISWRISKFLIKTPKKTRKKNLWINYRGLTVPSIIRKLMYNPTINHLNDPLISNFLKIFLTISIPVVRVKKIF